MLLLILPVVMVTGTIGGLRGEQGSCKKAPADARRGQTSTASTKWNVSCVSTSNDESPRKSRDCVRSTRTRMTRRGTADIDAAVSAAVAVGFALVAEPPLTSHSSPLGRRRHNRRPVSFSKGRTLQYEPTTFSTAVSVSLAQSRRDTGAVGRPPNNPNLFLTPKI